MLDNLKDTGIQKVSLDTFLQDHIGQSHPVVITDVVSGWPAYRKWSYDYFFNTLAEKRAAVSVAPDRKFEYKNDKPQYRSVEMPFTQILDNLAFPEHESERYYLMQRPLKSDFSELMVDIPVPGWMDEKRQEINLWLGAAHNITPLHYDFSENFMAQIFGDKQLTLFSPDQAAYLYPSPLSGNNAHISQVDVTAPDLDKYPKFSKAKPLTLTLHAGEMLYLPCHWWHCVHSLNFNAMINFWSPIADLQLYFSSETAIRALWFLYNKDILQSIKTLLEKSNMSFLNCAEKMLPINPSATVLFASAALMDLMLSMNTGNREVSISQLPLHIAKLVNNRIIEPQDVKMININRAIVTEAYQKTDIAPQTAQEMIEGVEFFTNKYKKFSVMTDRKASAF